jgi:hypothetical protein
MKGKRKVGEESKKEEAEMGGRVEKGRKVTKEKGIEERSGGGSFHTSFIPLPVKQAIVCNKLASHPRVVPKV